MLGGNHNHRIDWFSLYPFADKYIESYEKQGDTVIQDGAWLGMRSMIMPGLTIGEGAIIAAGTVVTKDVSPYSIVAGSPAKVIRKRFDDEVIKRILRLKVYDWQEEKFKVLKNHLCGDNIDALERANQEYDQQISELFS
ncbi:hypothetical protein TUM19329_07920 [Legionella antarctica]|uniref:Chloramphenicol acetyltransferase n=2 Tax=Legionella antarctica TaxID=2708020 RepID=A0A6F8T1U1_9GAMM|nr:hypothetical protein TUM19329_07920 [Legionella antarctica]